MLGALDERGFEPRVVAAGSEPADLRALRRVDTAWQAAGGRAWTGWAEGRNGENEIRPVVYRVPAEEVTPGTQQGVTVLSGALRATAAPVTAEPAPRPWLLALAGLVLVQAVGSLRRAAMITVMVLAGATVLRAQDVPEFSLQLWIPQESGPTAAGIEGVRQVVAAWVDRASPAVAPQPREFAWTTEDPEDPWVWWLGCRRFDPIADAQLGKRIESFVRSGGTLWIEACGGPTEVQSLVERVDRWVRARGLGTAARRIAADHVIFRTFYLLDDWFDPDGESGLYAVAVGAVDRIWIVPNLARGLATDPLAGPQLPLAPDGREILLRQSLNLLMYTTTYDYKNDSIHLPFILERRRRHR
jgi:hypothetical protein